MVFLIQRTQNKDSIAVQLKLNELVAAMEGASHRLINVEDLSEEELEVLHTYYCRLAHLAKQHGRYPGVALDRRGRGEKPPRSARSRSRSDLLDASPKDGVCLSGMRLAAVVVSVGVAASAWAGTTLERIEVVRTGPPAVRLHLSAPVATVGKTLPPDGVRPDRIYLDLPDTHLAAVPAELAGVDQLLRVRAGQFDLATTRVVLDLSSAVPFNVRPDGNTITIELAPPAPLATARPETGSGAGDIAPARGARGRARPRPRRQRSGRDRHQRRHGEDDHARHRQARCGACSRATRWRSC
jgi:hypothetical protein